MKNESHLVVSNKMEICGKNTVVNAKIERLTYLPLIKLMNHRNLKKILLIWLLWEFARQRVKKVLVTIAPTSSTTASSSPWWRIHSRLIGVEKKKKNNLEISKSLSHTLGTNETWREIQEEYNVNIARSVGGKSDQKYDFTKSTCNLQITMIYIYISVMRMI